VIMERVEAVIEIMRRLLAVPYLPLEKRFIDSHDMEQAAIQVTIESLERNEIPPLLARELVISRLRRDLAGAQPRHRGRDPFANMERDLCIVVAVGQTAQKFGFALTRNRATRDLEKRESACSIVAAALKRLGVEGISEDAVEKVWARWTGPPVGNK
jgi:hypothetical protein